MTTNTVTTTIKIPKLPSSKWLTWLGIPVVYGLFLFVPYVFIAISGFFAGIPVVGAVFIVPMLVLSEIAFYAHRFFIPLLVVYALCIAIMLSMNLIKRKI